MATYNISVTAAIIPSRIVKPHNTENKIYNLNDKLFFGDIQLDVSDYDNLDVSLSQFSSSTDNETDNNSSLILSRSKNDTTETHTKVSGNDVLGNLLFRGSDGSSSFLTAAKISAQSDLRAGEESSEKSMPGRLTFSTTPVGTKENNYLVNSVEAMRITREGYVSIGYKGTPESKLLIENGSTTIRTNSSFLSNYNKLIFDKSGSNVDGEHSSLGINNKIGGIEFRGSDGSKYIQVGSIYGETNSALSSEKKGKLVFTTTKDSNTGEIRASINETGVLKVENTSILNKLSVAEINSNLEIEKSLSVSGTSFLQSNVNMMNNLCVSKTIFALGNPGLQANTILIPKKYGYINFGTGVNDVGESGYGIRTTNVDIEGGIGGGVLQVKDKSSSWQILGSTIGAVSEVSNVSKFRIPTFTGRNGILKAQESLLFIPDNNNLHIRGNFNIKNNLNIGRNLSVKNSVYLNNLNINKNLNISGISNLSGSLSVKGNSNLSSKLDVGGNVNIKKNLSVGEFIVSKGLLNNQGNVFIDGAITISKISSDIIITGKTNLEKGLNIFGISDLNGMLSVNDDINIKGNVDVIGNANLKGSLSIGTQTKIFHDLTVESTSFLKTTTINNKLSINGQLFTGNNFTLSQNASIDSNLITDSLSVTGTALIKNDLSLSEGASMSSLSVAGSSNIHGSLDISGNAIMDSLSISGFSNILGGLRVIGKTNIEGNLSISKDLYGFGDIRLDGNMNISKKLSVGKISYFNKLNLSQNLNVYNVANIKGNLSVKEDIQTKNISIINSSGYINFDKDIYGINDSGIGLRFNSSSANIEFKKFGGTWGSFSVEANTGIIQDISNSSNNRIAFLDGTNSIKGDENFTFDGSTFIIGNMNISTNLNIAKNLSVGNSSLGTNITIGVGSKGSTNDTSSYEGTSNPNFSFAAGFGATASGDYSVAIGLGTKSSTFGQTTVGMYNKDISGNTTTLVASEPLFVIGSGSGTSDSLRSNALVMRKNADTTFSGNFNITKNVGVSSNLNISGSLSVNEIYFSSLNIDNSLNIGNNQNKNTNIGIESLYNIDTLNGNNSTLGYRAGYNIQCGKHNVYIGSLAGGNLSQTKTCGSYNLSIGAESGRYITNGNKNILIGYKAGDNITGGNRNIVIGTDSRPLYNLSENEIVIGNNIYGHGDNRMVFGNNDLISIHPHNRGMVDLGSSGYSLKNVYSDRIITTNQSNSVKIGNNSGSKIGKHSNAKNNVVVGTNADISHENGSNQIVIGYNVIGKGNNTATLGNGDITDVYFGQCSNASLHCNNIFAKGKVNIRGRLNIGGRLNVDGTSKIDDNLKIYQSGYLNFGLLTGSLGRGIRDNAGVIEGNHHGNWFPLEQFTNNTNKGYGLNVLGATKITGDLSVSGTTNFVGNLNVSGHTNVKTNLSIYGNAYLSQLSVSSFSPISGNLSIVGNVNIGNGLNVKGPTNLAKTLSVSGASYFAGVNISGNLSVAGNVNIKGTMCIRDTLYASNIRINNSLCFGRNLGIRDNLGIMEFKNNQAGDWHAFSTNLKSGSTSFDNGLNVKGTTKLDGTLSVSGTTNLNSNLIVGGYTNIEKSLSVAGNGQHSITPYIKGNSYFMSSVNIRGNLVVNNSNLMDINPTLKSTYNTSSKLFKFGYIYKNEVIIDFSGLNIYSSADSHYYIEGYAKKVIGDASAPSHFAKITKTYFGTLTLIKSYVLLEPNNSSDNKYIGIYLSNTSKIGNGTDTVTHPSSFDATDSEQLVCHWEGTMTSFKPAKDYDTPFNLGSGDNIVNRFYINHDPLYLILANLRSQSNSDFNGAIQVILYGY